MVNQRTRRKDVRTYRNGWDCLARHPTDEEARENGSKPYQEVRAMGQQAGQEQGAIGQQEEQIMHESIEEYIARKYGMEELLWQSEKKEKGR